MHKNNIDCCRKLRKEQTDAERKLWSVLRNRQFFEVKFRRQYPIDKYILDFYAPEFKLCIEADGGQHYENKGIQKDEIRTRDLNKIGIQVLRFSDLDILNNLEGVLEAIQRRLSK